jgi:hypothetical protein
MTKDTAPTAAAAGEQQVSASITGLTPDQTYYFQLVVAQGVGYQPSYSYGGVLSFTTMPVPATVATTGSATSVTATSAILNGVANTSTSVSRWGFRYGRSSSYGEATALQTVGPGVHALAYRLTGLRPGTLYHYQLDVLQYDQGGAHGSEGQDLTFRTPVLLGRLVLQGWRLRLARGHVEIPLGCRGAAAAVCAGHLALSARHAGRTLSIAWVGLYKVFRAHGMRRSILKELVHDYATIPLDLLTGRSYRAARSAGWRVGRLIGSMRFTVLHP